MNKPRIERWGEGHTHSNWSDGYSSLLENSARYQQFDHDFHIACDHLSIDVAPGGDTEAPVDWLPMQHHQIDAYRAEVLASSSSEHVAIDGIELTWRGADPESFGATNRHHVLVRDRLEAFPEPDFFHGVRFEDALAELKRRGMRPFLAHVDDAIPPDQLTGAEICGIEIRHDIERRMNPLELAAVPTWDRWLTAGHRVALSAGSDAHQMDAWAASGARNVVLADSDDREVIRDALLNGHSYLSSTWFDDLYLMLGYPPIIDGAGSFTPWWRIDPSTRRPPREQVRSAMNALTDAVLSEPGARFRRSQHPTMRFEIDGKTFGEETAVTRDARVSFAIDMHVPIESIRILSDGDIVHSVSGDESAHSHTGEITLDTTNRHYARIEAGGRDDQGHAEFLMGNPIYFTEQR